MNKFYIKITEKKCNIKAEFDIEANSEIKLWLAKALSQNAETKKFIQEAIDLSEKKSTMKIC